MLSDLDDLLGEKLLDGAYLLRRLTYSLYAKVDDFVAYLERWDTTLHDEVIYDEAASW